MAAVVPTEAQLHGAIRSASANWRNWRPCWEHAGDWRKHPLLVTQLWFGCFVWEYGLGRNFSRTHAADLRGHLRGCPHFTKAVELADFASLQAAAEGIVEFLKTRANPPGGKMAPRSQLPSLASKLAAFIRPASFMAWDTYATAGLRKIIAGSGEGFGDSLVKYQHVANAVANGHHNLGWWAAALPLIEQEGKMIGADEAAFRLRVLDWVAMEVGVNAAKDPPLKADTVINDFHVGWTALHDTDQPGAARGGDRR